MKHFFILLNLLILSTDFVWAESYMSKMGKSEDKDSVQVFMSFDQIPRHESKVSGKRLNIVLRNTIVDENTSIFQENEKIIKVLTRPLKDATVVSLFFRYTPQKVTIVPSNNNTLVADVLLGNRFSKTYQDFSSQLQGVTLLDRKTKDYANPLIASPYAHNWKRFFSQYESPVSITSPVSFFIPSFPIIRLLPPRKNRNIVFIPDEALQSAAQGHWNEVASIIHDQIPANTDIEIQKLAALTYGEALLHAGNFSGSYKQLYLLKNKYPQEQVGLFASYLLALLVAIHDDPYSADYELRNLNELIRQDNPLAPFLQLSLAETSLSTNQLDQLKNILSRDDIAYPKEIEFRRELRQADYLYATNKSVKAYVAYQFVSEQNNIYDQPYSLNGYCNTLYKQRSFKKSADCYTKLASKINDRAELGKAYYLAAMSKLKFSNDTAQLVSEFSRIEDAFPGTEAGFRAALKKTDLQYLTREKWADTAVKYYHALATKSAYRPVGEEAYFKEALLYHLKGDNGESIKLLMTLLRNFRSGDIRPNAEALLVQLLPGELKRLIEEKNFTSALALARQNRRLFDNNWIDIRILSNLAYSYRQLGIFNDALRLYHYLVQIASIEEKEKYFLPLTEIALDKGDYNLVEDYTTQYLYYYPAGNFLDDINYLRVKSLFSSDQIDKAIKFLPSPLPESDKFSFIAAMLHFRTNNFPIVVQLLLPLWNDNKQIPADLCFILAESLFKTDKLDKAQPVYETCKKSPLYSGQSIFRLAEIARAKGDEKQAIDLFTEITNQEEDSLWKKYAEKELKLNKLSRSF